ncbi:MAG TPA: response regulator [Bryobacteraceae bacterium]|jgi:CheY-like chemotaxis protein
MKASQTNRRFSTDIDSPSRSKRVLVVEDEWVVARDLSDLLQRLGHVPVGPAANSSDAIRLASVEKPDLILMDIQLDGSMNGATAAAEIARRLAVPVIYITANSHVFLNGDSEMVAPYICIAKPFSEKGVSAAIESVPL